MDHFARSCVSHCLDRGDAIRRKEQDQIAPRRLVDEQCNKITGSGIRPLDHAGQRRKNSREDCPDITPARQPR